MENKNNINSDDLRFENEVRKAKLTLEKGAKFYSGGDAHEIPPDIESDWLNHMEKFEDAMENGDEILIYDFIGRPKFIKESELPDEQIPEKLKELEELMMENGLMCDTICEVDDRVFYKFITEELFNKETLNIRIPDMITHFIYEEFHPNPELYISDLCRYFTQHFFEEDMVFFNNLVETKHISNYSELLSLRNAFVKCSNPQFRKTSCNISGHLATVHFKFEFDGYVNLDQSPIHYEGDGRFNFECFEDIWHMTWVNLPGMAPSM